MRDPAPVGDPLRWDGDQCRSMAVVDPREVAWVSQFGRVDGEGNHEFREVPRFERINPIEFEVSMMRGHRTAEEVAFAVRHMRAPERKRKRDRVRWFRTEALLNAGYFVMHTPTPRNPDHVSVYGNIKPGELLNLEVNTQWWFSSARVTLSSLAHGIGGDEE